MLRKVLEKKPWHASIRRAAAFLDRSYKTSSEKRSFYFEDLGRPHIDKVAGRCLVAFMPEFIRYLYHHPDVGPRGWHSVKLKATIEKLAQGFVAHQMFWDSAEMVRQLIARGFVVDYVCGRHGHLIKDVQKYDVIIDEWTSLPSWAHQNPKSKKLFYATGAHWIFHNKAEMTRHDWLFRRRGVELAVNRQVPHLLGDTHADIITTFGNREVDATFGANAEKIRKLCTTAVLDDIQLPRKNWSQARQSFLFFASPPWWHKGLDLVVEAFLRDRTLQLHVVTGGVDHASDFWQLYGAEISESGNIFVHGFLNSVGVEFLSLVNICVGIILPSASEGCAGSVVQALHHGLIPIVTPIVGLKLNEEWPALMGKSDSELISEIQSRCRELTEMPEPKLEELRQYFWQYARTNHTRALYSQMFSSVLDELLDGAFTGRVRDIPQLQYS